jgi:serine O-acetyltransferase
MTRIDTLGLWTPDNKLDGVVGALAALRKASQTSRYGNGAIPELPSRSAVVDLVEALTSALYPRHFGPYELTPDATDAFVARTLDRGCAH